MTHEPEITRKVVLTRPDGTLDPSAIGWTREPLHHCPLPTGWGRRKRWVYWGVFCERGALQITLADLDYLGLAIASFLDFETGELVEVRRALPFAIGLSLGDSIQSERVQLGGLRIEIDERAHETHLRVRSREIDADVTVERPDGHQSLGVVVPWSERCFQYTSKDVARRAAGEVRVGRAIAIDGHATLDFGRGIWPAKIAWNWGGGAEDAVGFTLGGKWTEGTGMTENAIVVGGALSKIADDLEWSWDRKRPEAVWSVRSPRSDAVDLTFAPARIRKVNAELGIAHSRLVAGFGHWSGTIRADGRSVHIERALGWAEEHEARW